VELKVQRLFIQWLIHLHGNNILIIKGSLNYNQALILSAVFMIINLIYYRKLAVLA